MIKPRSQPSHFELQVEAQPWNLEGKFCSCSSDSFNQLNENSMLPVAPMASVTPPATTDRDSKVRKSTDPIISTGALQSTVGGATPSVSTPATPRHSTHSTKGVPPVHSFQEIAVMEYSGNFHLCRACSESARTISVSVSKVQTCETWNYV